MRKTSFDEVFEYFAQQISTNHPPLYHKPINRMLSQGHLRRYFGFK